MKRPKRSSGPSMSNDISRMVSVLGEACLAHHKKRYKRCLQKLYELSVLTSEYNKKGKPECHRPKH